MRAWPLLRRDAGAVGARIETLLTIASFVVYAVAVLALHWQRHEMFLAEREALGAAVSTTVYGAPLGTMYSDVSARIRDPHTPLETALKQATESRAAPGVVLQDGGMEGNGIGYLVLATGAMLIFGVKTSSPILAMLALMGVSGGALLWRFGPHHAVVVPLYFIGLTLLLFTPVVWQPNVAAEIPVGGIRYFCVVGMLPAFHLGGELLDTAAPRLGTGWERCCLLAIQAIILVMAVLTRTSNAGLLAAIGLIGLYSLWRHRRDRPRLLRQLCNGALVAGAAGGFIALIIVLLPPKYLSEGRITGNVWHRALIGLGFHPAWPFGNLREIYDCNYDGFPRLQLEPGLTDMNGVCVWLHFSRKQYPSQRLPDDGLAVVSHEPVLREAFFNIVHLYPHQVLMSYIYYKSLILYGEIEQAIYPKFDLTSYSPLLKGLFVAALIILLASLASASPSDSVRGMHLVGMVLIFGLSFFPGYYIAWPGTSQTFDLKLSTLLLVGAVLHTSLQWVKKGILAMLQ